MSVDPTEFSAKVSQAWVSARLILSGGSGDGSSSKTIIHWSAELSSGGRGLGTLFPCWLSVRGCDQALRASWPLHVQSQRQQAKSNTQNLCDIIPS